MHRPLALAAFAPLLLALAPHPAQAQCFRQGKFTTTDLNDKYGRGLAVGRGFVAVGAPNDSSLASQAGKLFVYEDLGSGWVQSATIQPATLSAVDLYGFSVAAGSSLIAASALFDDAAGTDAGAVYVHRRIAGVWTLEQKLLPPVAGSNLNYGRTIALGGNVLAVAEWGPPALVHVYRYDGSSWVFEQSLAPSFADQRYGTDVAVSGDVIVVGDPEYGIKEGAIEVYRHASGAWTSELVAFGAVGSTFGESVAAHGDRVVGGASEVFAGGSGHADVFLYASGSWALEQTLFGAGSVAGDGVGYAVAMASSGIYLGAPGDDAQGTNAGAVHAFTLGGGVWTQANLLAPNVLAAFDNFGTSVAAAGTTLAVGNQFQVFAPPADPRGVYVFTSCP